MTKRTPESTYRLLITAAERASRNAYRPYSKFPVGAAVLTFDGRIYVGCNVENAAYTPTAHAEEVAVCNAIADGALKRAQRRGLSRTQFIVALAVYIRKGTDPWPCGGCRQFLSEFGLDIPIVGYAGTDRSRVLRKTLRQLMPHITLLESVQGKRKAPRRTR